MPSEDLRPKLSDPVVRPQVQQAMGQLLKDINQKLPEHEHLRMIVIAGEPWSIDNGCLTPTLKIRRNRIESVVAPKVDSWYSDQSSVQWA
jgi:long-subunit acyl-CoA synthetase (AMP-forming)